jgi:hypothetical protein
VDSCSPRLKKDHVERVIELVGRLEDLEDVREIPKLLIPERP